MEKDELFTIDTKSSFSGSNEWLFNKIIDVELVYPNISEASVSSEMTGFYICLVIASVLGEKFVEEFKDVVLSYNFKTWQQDEENSFDFVELACEWIQMGSETVKMIVAAAKYALARNSKKKEIQSQLELPEDMVLKYNDLRWEIANIRFIYDNKKLSEEQRSSILERFSSFEINKINTNY